MGWWQWFHIFERKEDKKLDIISSLSNNGLSHLNADIFKYVEGESLCKAKLVSSEWRNAILRDSRTLKALMEEKARNDFLWRSVIQKKQLMKYIVATSPTATRASAFSSQVYEEMLSLMERTRDNWLECGVIWNQINRRVCCMQYDSEKIVTGHRNGDIRIWSRKGELRNTLTTNPGVRCLRFNDKVIISGHDDGTVIVWNIRTGKRVHTITYHSQDVAICLKNNILVTSSSDEVMAIFNIQSETEVLLLHLITIPDYTPKVACDEKYTIVSCCYLGEINVWNTSTGQLVREFGIHRENITCMKYNGKLVVTAGCKIALWDVESGRRLRVLKGHAASISVIHFDSHHLLSGDEDGTIKIWDMEAALNSGAPSDGLCLETLKDNKRKIFWLSCEEVETEKNPGYNDVLIWDIFYSVADFVSFVREHRLIMHRPHECTVM